VKTPFSMTSHSLFTELLALTASILLITILSIGWYTTSIFSENTHRHYLQSLETIAEKKSGEISAYISNHLSRIRGIAHLKSVTDAIRQFDLAYQAGVKSGNYSDAMRHYDRTLRRQLDEWGYTDLFLINTSGEIVYSANRKGDFATNLNSGPYRESQLAAVYRDAMTLLQASNSSFDYYAPSDEPAAFLAAPLLDDDTFLGVLALKVSADEFDAVITDLTGLGATGETVTGRISGGRIQITIPLRHDPDAAFRRTLELDAVAGKPIIEAANGISGTGTQLDWRGEEVVAAWQYIPSMRWGMVVKIDTSEAFASLHQTQRLILISTLIGLLLAFLATVIVARHITRPLSELSRIYTLFSAGQRSIRMDTSAITENETYRLADGFNRMAEQIEESEKSLKKERERLAIAVEQSHDAVIITDLEGDIQYVNHAFETISGYSNEEALGRHISMLDSDEMGDAFYRDMWGALKKGRAWQGELVNRHKNGSLYTVEQTTSPILDEDNLITGYVSLLYDITEKKNALKRLEHQQRLESLGVLAGGIAHDFNNLLTVILGNASLAQSQLEPASPVAKMLGSIHEASENAAELCRQMLAYSGKGKFVVQPINLSTLVENMMGLLNISISKNVHLDLNLATDIPSVMADKTQMQQVVMNLVINASEAIGEKPGTITIHTGHMHASREYLDALMVDEPLPEGAYVYLEVSDSGSGINEEIRSKIFDPFFSTKFTGRGLGMSAVLGIVRGHQGAINIYSEPGRGTTFKLLFPASEMEARHTVPKPVQQTEWKGSGTVLVVDDDQTLQKTAATMLADMGFEVLVASDGIEGVEKFRQHREKIVAVLLDMTMPRMSGEDAFKQMRIIDPDAVVILSSGYNEQDATNAFSGKGLAGFIQKPYGYDTLKRKLIHTLDQM